MNAQTKGVDVLSDLRGVVRIAKAASIGVSGNAARIQRAEDAIAAIAEMIEADKEYDAALSAFSDGPRPELSATSMNAWADEWGRVAERADLRERLQSAKERRAAALSRIGGAK